MMLRRVLCGAVLLPLLHVSSLFADDVVIANVKVYEGPGSEPEVIAIRSSEGVITEWGRGFSAAGAFLYPGNEGYVTPGFIDSGSILGIAEAERNTYAEDQTYEGKSFSAAFDPGMAFNRYSSAIPLSLEEGVTRVLVRPDLGEQVLAGQARLLTLPNAPELSDEDAGVLFVYLGESGRNKAGKSRAAALQYLLTALNEAQVFASKRRDYERNRIRELSLPLADLEVLASVLEGRRKLGLYIDAAAEIENVLNALDEYALDIVLFGAREAWKVTEAISSRDIPVVINVLDNRPSRFERLGARRDLAAQLHEAGITIAFMTEDQYSETRMLKQAAGVAVAHGLPWQAAIDAITINPAKIWGIADRVGSLEIGKEATFVVWDGDPLELTSSVKYLVVKGEMIEIENRQKLLRDRYRSFEKGKPFVYR